MSEPVDVGTGKQLFLDDELIEYRRDVEFVVNRPAKEGIDVLVPEAEWEQCAIGGWVNVIEEDGRHQMWYYASAPPETEGGEVRGFTCYAESDDGLHWSRPNLGLIEYRGSRDNNIVMPTGAYQAGGLGIFKDPNGPPEERYKAIATSSVSGESLLSGFTSPDGVRWTPLASNPIVEWWSDTHQAAFWDESRRAYVAFVRGWSGGDRTPDKRTVTGKDMTKAPAVPDRGKRQVCRMETKDFAHWPKPTVVLEAGYRDAVPCDFYNSAALKYPWADRAYFIFTSAYYGTSFQYAEEALDTIDVQFAVSRDGIHWRRPDRKPWVRTGLPGSGDSKRIYMGQGVLAKDDRLYMYYGGFDVPHGYGRQGSERLGVVRRVSLRRDGYMSADAAYEGGELLTKPFVFAGRTLEYNVDLSAGGVLWTEIQDAEGRPIEGFARGDSDRITGNHLCVAASWGGESDLSALAGRAIRLRILMRDSKLYAFQFSP